MPATRASTAQIDQAEPRNLIPRRFIITVISGPFAMPRSRWCPYRQVSDETTLGVRMTSTRVYAPACIDRSAGGVLLAYRHCCGQPARLRRGCHNSLAVEAVHLLAGGERVV